MMSESENESYEIPLEDGFIESMLMHGTLNLDLAGIQFVEGWKHLCEGRKMYAKLEPELKKLDDILRRVDKAMKATDREDALVDVAQNIGGLEDSYSPVISHLGLAIILLVSSAEAYINDVASHILRRGEANHFDKLTPVGKWLFLPKVMKLGFQPDLGKSPLQEFSEVVTRRNVLLHPKPKRQRGMLQLPKFIELMGLDPDTGNKALESVRQLIRQFCLSWRGSYGPDWLYPDSEHFRIPGFYIGNIEASARLARPGDIAD
ncbi:MAG: hypothetical protein KAT11_05140 [Phycisphaerae bacterium]|nr:hypothetical protein [Phycisphaerae bacterium]